MVKIIKHPTSEALEKYLFDKTVRIKAKKGAFSLEPRTENQTVNNFMDKADALIFSSNTIEREAELFNKALIKDTKLVFLSQKLNKLPKTPEEIKEYKEISNKFLDVAKKCGADTLHDNMKTAFDLIIDQAEKGSNFKIDTFI